jgi:hypothetical protein
MAYRPPHGVPKVYVLSDVEIVALRNVVHHHAVKPPSYRRLKRLGLIEQNLDGWNLTQQGQIHLMFVNAR